MRTSLLIVAAAAFATLLVPAAGAFAQGESGAHCLIIPPSARANGMGQTYVAISDDATSSWWNPAGLAFLDKSVDIMYSQLVPELASDVKYAYFGGSTKLSGLGTIGATCTQNQGCNGETGCAGCAAVLQAARLSPGGAWGL